MGMGMKHVRYMGRDQMPSIREFRRAFLFVYFNGIDGQPRQRVKKSGEVLHDIGMLFIYAALFVLGVMLFSIGWFLTRLWWTLGKAWIARKRLTSYYHRTHPNEFTKENPKRWH